MMATTGTVTEIDLAAPIPRARVALTDAHETDWLPILQSRAGEDGIALAPTVGEQVIVLPLNDDLAQAVILGSLPQDAHPAPITAAGIHIARYRDGAEISYDSTAHALDLTLPAGATLSITAPGGITITGNVTVTGTLNSTGNQTAAGISQATHVHTSASAGSPTSPPLP